MLETFAIIAVVLALLVGAVLAYAATKPDTFRFARTATIHAPPETIFPLINDLKGFATWSPFETKDPNMRRAYSGPERGRGATYEWDGNKNIGAGRLAIAQSSAPSRVTMNLDMTRPFACHNVVEFAIEPTEGRSSRVTWAMSGKSTYVSKVMCAFVDMDSMCGKDFETGLAQLKALAERQPAIA